MKTEGEKSSKGPKINATDKIKNKTSSNKKYNKTDVTKLRRESISTLRLYGWWKQFVTI